MNFIRKHFFIVVVLLINLGWSQTDEPRLLDIASQLELLSDSNEGLNEKVKTEIQINNITLSNFLLAISELHHVNINVDPELDNITLANNFSDVTLADLLVFLCKEHNLTIDFTGNILSIKKYKPIEEKLTPVIAYDPTSNTISIEAKEDQLHQVFKIIMDKSGKNLVFTPGMENKPLNVYYRDIPFDIAMDKMALGNNLVVTKTKDNFYVFDQIQVQGSNGQTVNIPIRRRSGNITYKILDEESKLLEVDFVNEPIANIISEIAEALNLDIFTATSLDKAGVATLKAKSISFDDLLIKLFESQSVSVNPTAGNQDNNRGQSNTNVSSKEKIFSFKKEGSIYFFGTENQLSIRKAEVVFLQHRSVELLEDPQGNAYQSRTSDMVFNNLNAGRDNFRQSPSGYNGGNRQNATPNNNNPQKKDLSTTLVGIMPEEITADLDIKVDYELNSFYVNGPSAKVNNFKSFMKKIDKPVPVILIEVMILEVKKSATIEAGVSFGIGDEPVNTVGTVFPDTDLTLGANTVNKIIGSFNDFGGFNLGKVGPNFFASLKAMETNGDIKVRSTPKLATLNSHRATFSNGQTSFYAVTDRNFYGTDNPQISEYVNYFPIDAELALTIRPSVSGDGQVLLDISVIQSSFGGRVADDAPPDVNSRSFSSLIRMKDQDMAILGGLEEQYKNNSGRGVPLLSKVPILKWLVSKRKRESSKSKLTILIKPTVINN